MRLLLESGADVNASGGQYGSMLQAVSYWSDDSIVRLLLESGADVNAQGGLYGTTLNAAIKSLWDTRIVQQLLCDYGACES